MILTKRLDFRIEKEKSSLSEAYSRETLSEEKTLSFESVNSQASIQINVGLDAFRDILPSGFLAILSSFAESVGFFDPFLRHLTFPMKEVSYSTIDKIATLFSSIIVGCSHIKDINHKLTPYPSAASLFGMERFPDQSQINRFLNRMGPEEISEFCLIFEGVLDKVALFQDQEKVDLNVDATGLTVYGNSSSTAKRILRELAPSYDEWRRVDETTWAYEVKYLTIRRCPYPARTVLTKAIDAKGKIDYRHIYTSFSPKEMDEVEVAISFRKRSDIESIIRDDKYGLHIDNLRTKNFYGIWAYLFIACATHNLISLFRKRVLSGTGIGDLGIQTINNKLTDIPAKFEKEQQRMRILFPAGHELARRFIQGKEDNHKAALSL